MGYKANITMHSIRMFGLSGINLAESIVTRNENLTDIDIKLLFAFDELMLNGSYAMKVSNLFSHCPYQGRGKGKYMFLLFRLQIY